MGRTLEEISQDIRYGKGTEGFVCQHDVVMDGLTPSGDKVSVCTICGMTKYAVYNQKGVLIPGGIHLNLTQNPLGLGFVAEESMPFLAFREMVIDGACVEPKMTIQKFVGTIDESFYTSAKPIKEVLEVPSKIKNIK